MAFHPGQTRRVAAQSPRACHLRVDQASTQQAKRVPSSVCLQREGVLFTPIILRQLAIRDTSLISPACHTCTIVDPSLRRSCPRSRAANLLPCHEAKDHPRAHPVGFADGVMGYAAGHDRRFELPLVVLGSIAGCLSMASVQKRARRSGGCSASNFASRSRFRSRRFLQESADVV